MKKTVKILFCILSLLSAATLSTVGFFQYKLADNYYVTEGSVLELNAGELLASRQDGDIKEVSKSGSTAINGYSAKLSLFGLIPIKTVSVTEVSEQSVAVLGTPFGIKMFTEGVLVVGYSDIEVHGSSVNPAKSADIRIGDIILKINRQNVDSSEAVQEIVRKNGNKPLELSVKRDSKIFNVVITPQKSASDKNYKLGLWIKDSQAGIGTLTFYSPSLGVVAGLGHGICDTDTGKLIPMQTGEFVGAEIIGINKSDQNNTGELRGVFAGGKIAEIKENCETGVYGINFSLSYSGQVLPIAMKQEVKAGKAEIITTVDSTGPKSYECVIKKVYHNDSSKIKNMVIEITDTELLEKTGGIVQGMSGSPIIQNGKLIGAVTHVLVDDPTRGYAIFAENMLETARSLEQSQKQKDAS